MHNKHTPAMKERYIGGKNHIKTRRNINGVQKEMSGMWKNILLY